MTFLKKRSSLLESTQQPLNVHYNFHRHPRLAPAVYQVSIFGPFDRHRPRRHAQPAAVLVARAQGPGGRRGSAPGGSSPHLARRAFRRPVDDADLRQPLVQYRQARAESDFEAGIEVAVSAILVNPRFLLRIERDPADAAAGTVYRITPVELASRLSFFLWSSIPDDELLGPGGSVAS